MELAKGMGQGARKIMVSFPRAAWECSYGALRRVYEALVLLRRKRRANQMEHALPIHKPHKINLKD